MKVSLKKKQNTVTSEVGFTLIEMLIVILIITLLLMIAVPKLANNNDVVKDRSCEATAKLIRSQMYTFEIEHKRKPTTIEELQPYVSTTECPDGRALAIENGEVVIKRP